MKLNFWTYLCLAMLLAMPMAFIGCGGDDDDSAGDDDDTTGDDDDTSVGDDDTSVGDDDSAGDDDDTSVGDDDSAVGDDDDDSAIGDDDDSAAPPPDPTCADYCASRVTNCGDDMAVCTATCGLATGAGLLAGAWSDTGGNTLGCRIYHSGVAAGDNTSTHCGHSNLFGGTSADGFPCTNSLVEPYCGLMMANCTGANSQFADGAACWAAAGSVPDDSTTPWPTAGDSIQCRIYHAEVAASSGDPGTHCPHAGGAAPCQ